MHSRWTIGTGRQACAEILTSWPARRPFRREGNVRQRTNILSRPVRHQDPTDIGSSETPGRRHAHRYMYSIGYGPNACTEIENSGEAILHLITAHSQAKFSFRRTRGHRTGAHTDPNSTPLEGPCAQLRPWTSPRPSFSAYNPAYNSRLDPWTRCLDQPPGRAANRLAPPGRLQRVLNKAHLR